MNRSRTRQGQAARTGAWLAGACGLLLAAGAPSYAQVRDGGPGARGGVSGSDTTVTFQTGAKGADRSGNVTGGENVRIAGNANQSGSPSNINGSTNAANESHGTSIQSDNDWQSIGSGGAWHR